MSLTFRSPDKKQLALKASTELKELCEYLNIPCQDERDEKNLNTASLRTYGGEKVDRLGVYSWDRASVLIHDGQKFVIVSRTELQ